MVLRRHKLFIMNERYVKKHFRYLINYYLFIIYLLFVYYLFIIYFLLVYYLFIICLLFFFNLFICHLFLISFDNSFLIRPPPTS